MASTQALLSMETGRKLLGGRPLQSSTCTRTVGSQKRPSSVVRAASTPPVKFSARSREAALVRIETVSQLLGWKPSRRLRVRPARPFRPGGHWRVHRAQVAGLRRGNQRPVRHARHRRSHRPGDPWQIGTHPGRDRPPLVQNRRHPAGWDLQLLGRPIHALRIRDGADGVRRAPAVPRLGESRFHGEAILLGFGEVSGRVRRPSVSRRAVVQPAGFWEGREVAQGAEAKGGEERQACYVGHIGFLRPGAGDRSGPVSEPIGPFGRSSQQQCVDQSQVPLS